MTDKKHWILKIVPALAFAAGIIMASIGGMMTLSSTAKLALFEQGPYSYISKDQCEYDYNRQPIMIEERVSNIATKPTNPKQYKRTPLEVKECLNEKRTEEKQRFQQDKKQDIVDGISALIVGLILIFAFRRKK